MGAWLGDMARRAARYSLSIRGDGGRVTSTTDWKPAGTLQTSGAIKILKEPLDVFMRIKLTKSGFLQLVGS